MEGSLVGESIIVGRELGPVYWTGDKWAGTEPVTKMQHDRYHYHSNSVSMF